MPLYYFNVRDGAGGLRDDDGTELRNTQAAWQHADGVARELMSHAEARRRHWSVVVRDADGGGLFELPFLAVDDSLRHLSAETRRLIEQMCERKLALARAMFEGRLGVLQARATIARSRSRPYLAAENGRLIAAG